MNGLFAAVAALWLSCLAACSPAVELTAPAAAVSTTQSRTDPAIVDHDAQPPKVSGIDINAMPGHCDKAAERIARVVARLHLIRSGCGDSANAALSRQIACLDELIGWWDACPDVAGH
jgi:hypothetical protein